MGLKGNVMLVSLEGGPNNKKEGIQEMSWLEGSQNLVVRKWRDVKVARKFDCQRMARKRCDLGWPANKVIRGRDRKEIEVTDGIQEMRWSEGGRKMRRIRADGAQDIQGNGR